MPTRRDRRLPTGLAIVGLLASTAAGQNVGFLTPASFAAEADAPVRLRVERGDSAKQTVAAAWPAHDLRWLFVRAGGDQMNLHKLAADASGYARVKPPHPGIVQIGLYTERIESATPGADLRAFAQRRIAPQRQPAALATMTKQATVRLRRQESFKSIVRVAARAGEQPLIRGAATGKAGLPTEIRLLIDPTRGQVGGDIPLKAYVDGSSAGGVRLLATHLPSGKTHELTADRGGAALLHLDAAGQWRVEFHHLAQDKSADADWLLASSTITFEALEGDK